jgi:putative membrane protein
MLTVAYVFAALAALVHVYIFWIEAIVFETSGRKVFGIGAEDAATMKGIFYNQGFYNLFLAIGTAVGLGMAHSDRHAAIALITLATGSMLAAALVLITSDASKARGAVVQGLFPLIGLVALGVWAVS